MSGSDNYAQKAQKDRRFYDSRMKQRKEKTSAGSKIKVDHYSDGSSAHHFGGPVGTVTYDKYGEEC
jgi:hypothetical protein